MKTKILTLLLLAIFGFGCSSDDSGSGSSNKYTYDGKNYRIVKTEYMTTDGDFYLFFQGSGTANYVQVVFANTESIPVGTFTYNNERYSPSYNPATNFWSGVVSTQINPLGYLLNGGTITISQTETGYEATFSVTNVEGEAIGQFKGQLVPR